MQIRKACNLIAVVTPQFRAVQAQRLEQAKTQLEQQFAAQATEIRRTRLHITHTEMQQASFREEAKLNEDLAGARKQLEQQSAILDLPDGARIQIGQCEMAVEVGIGSNEAEIVSPGMIVLRDGFVIETVESMATMMPMPVEMAPSEELTDISREGPQVREIVSAAVERARPALELVAGG